MLEYIYPNQDVPPGPFYFRKFPGGGSTNEYDAIEEGVLSPDDSDYIYDSGLKAHFQNIDFRSVAFYTTEPHILPSSVSINIRGSASGVPTASGDIFVVISDFLVSKPEELPNYRYKGVYNNLWNPTTSYKFSVNSGISNLYIPVSGIPSTSLDGSETRILEIHYSGYLHTPSPTTDLFQFNIYATDIFNSGLTGVQHSGIPLFLKAQDPFTECIVPISSYTRTDVGNPGLNTWLASPNLYDASVRTPEQSNQVDNHSFTWNIDDGVHSPIDSDYIYYSGGSLNSYSPRLIFNKPTINADRMISSHVCFRILDENKPTDVSGNYIQDYLYISNIQLKDEITDNKIVQYNDFVVTPHDNSAAQNFINVCSEPSGFNMNLWGNRAYLQFEQNRYWGPSTTPGSSSVLYSEIEICCSGLDPFMSGSVPLYTKGHIPDNSSIPLYVYGNDSANSGIPLYTAGPFPNNSGIPLYTNGITTANSSIPLYIRCEPIVQCIVPVSSSPNNTLRGGQWKNELNQISSNTFFYKSVNSGVHTPDDNSFMVASGINNNGIDYSLVRSPLLYFNRPHGFVNQLGSHVCYRLKRDDYPNSGFYLSQGLVDVNTGNEIASWENIYVTPSSSYNTYCTSPSSINFQNWTPGGRAYFQFEITKESLFNPSGIKFSEIEICTSGIGVAEYIPLFINGHQTSNSGIPLTVTGHVSSSSGIPLYISGPLGSNSSMPLFVKVQEPGTIGSGLPLSIWSSTNSGLFSTIPLFIGGSGDIQGSMPLFMKGPPFGESSAGMPLFLKMGNLNGTISADGGIPLYLQNSNIEASSYIPLYLAVQSGTPGAIPVNASMPLFMARDGEGYASSLPLYIKVADMATSGLAMYVDGVYTSNSGIPLVIPGTYDVKTSPLKLYVNGF